MFIMDIPPEPPRELPVIMVQAGNEKRWDVVMQDLTPKPPKPTVIIAQANQAQPSDVTTTRTLGVCYPVPSDQYSGENTLSPIVSAATYLLVYEHQKVQKIGTITVLQQPTHGTLRLVTEADRGTLFAGTHGPMDPTAAAGFYAYLPEKGYLGKDSATLLVDIGGIKVKVVYFFQAIEGPLGNTGWADLCSETGTRWKISSTIDTNGNSTITSVEYQSPTTSTTGTTVTDTAALASALGINFLGSSTVDQSAITLNIADLPGGAVGQTTGTNITLDTNAANYNWFVDTTPADNSEYLPTSNPGEWVAKAGTAA